MRLPWWLPIGRVPEIEAGELARRLRSEPNAQVIDVRSSAEFHSDRIQGARSTPIQSFRQVLPTLELDPDRPVFVICRTAHRSIPAVRLLRSQGFEAYQLAGGMNTWWREKLPVIRD